MLNIGFLVFIFLYKCQFSSKIPYSWYIFKFRAKSLRRFSLYLTDQSKSMHAGIQIQGIFYGK
jgi:hypothetical protein